MPRMQPRTFTGAVVVLTGAASGIGEQMALQLADEGAARLVLVDRNAERLESVAGVSMYGRFDEMTTEDFFWLTDINLRAPVVLTHALLPALKAAPGSHIVNLSSLFGLIAPGGQTAYVTSKFGLRGFGESLRVELARDRVGVTTAHPGGIRTRIASEGRRAANASEPGHARQLRAADKVLRMPPARAASVILGAARRRRTTVVVGADAKALQWVPRLVPSRMGEVLALGDRARR